MREIKFRIWYLRDKVMNKGFGFHDLSGDDGGEVYAHQKWPPLNCSEDIIFMQYTGLKDKNGKEIYEGDLIKNEFGRICEVIWHEYAGCWDAKVRKFGAESKGGHLGFQNNEWLRHITVIGNIYENPELLELGPSHNEVE